MAPSRPKVVRNASRDIPFSKLMLPVSAERGPASRRAMPALPSPAAELARLLSEKAERVCRHYLYAWTSPWLFASLDGWIQII